MIDTDKRSSLLWILVNGDAKKFYEVDTRTQTMTQASMAVRPSAFGMLLQNNGKFVINFVQKSFLNILT